jgi:hypothetical protein
MLTAEQNALRFLLKLTHPINLNPLPDCLPSGLADKLMKDGAIDVRDPIYGENGELFILNGVTITEIGQQIAYPKTDWLRLSAIIALAGIIITVVIFLINRDR